MIWYHSIYAWVVYEWKFGKSLRLNQDGREAIKRKGQGTQQKRQHQTHLVNAGTKAGKTTFALKKIIMMYNPTARSTSQMLQWGATFSQFVWLIGC
jgi:hypothetical protein